MTLDELIADIEEAINTADDVGEAKSNVYDVLPKVRAYSDEKDAVIAARDADISDRDAIIAERDARITDLEEKRARLLEEKGEYIDNIIKKKNGETETEEKEEISFSDFVR